jgi:hypothetical protein
MKIFHEFKKSLKEDIYGVVTAGIIALQLGLPWVAVLGFGPLTGIYSNYTYGIYKFNFVSFCESYFYFSLKILFRYRKKA